MEKIEKITDLYQLYISPVILKDFRLSPVDRLLIAIIAAFDKGRRGCWLNNATLGRLANCSSGTVSRSVNKMYNFGHITVNRQSTINGGRSYMRKVAPYVKRKYAESI
ncbi:MAG: helix-turn-helix domain-containing protein [Chitinophagaceae bacterium]